MDTPWLDTTRRHAQAVDMGLRKKGNTYED